jgi:hypothetical protein
MSTFEFRKKSPNLAVYARSNRDFHKFGYSSLKSASHFLEGIKEIRNYDRFWQVQLDSLEAYLEEAKKEGKTMGKNYGDKSHTLTIVRTLDS